jgi:hypothetical protein
MKQRHTTFEASWEGAQREHAQHAPRRLGTTPKAPKGAPLLRRRGGQTMNPTWECAMLKTADGAAVPRPGAQRSLLKGLVALAAAGGRVPTGPDGTPMLWNERHGWFPRGGNEGKTRRAGRPIAELMKRQTFVSHKIRQDRLDREIRADDALIRGASPLAWLYARQFRRGFLPQPPLDASADELTGWRLARRGYDSPPTWLLQERRDGSIR